MAIALNTPRAFFTNKTGDKPLSYGRVSFYEAGTTTLKEIYSNQQQTDNLPNPLRLNIGGQVPSNGAWLGDGFYKIVVEKNIGKDEQGNDIYALEYTIDDYIGTPSDETGLIKDNIVVNSVSDLRAISTDNKIVYCLGYYDPYDGGGGWFEFNSESTKSDDGGAYISPNGNPATGRYLRIFNGVPNVRMWGAIEGQSNVAINIKNASIYCARSEVRTAETLLFPSGSYSIADVDLLLDDSRDGKKVTYELEGGCEFLQTTGTNAIVFSNPTLIHGKTKIADRLFVLDSTLGFVYAEWWGAKAETSTSVASFFFACVGGCNGQAIKLLKGVYLFGGVDVLINNRVIFSEGSSVDGGSSNLVIFSNIDKQSSSPIFNANLANVSLTIPRIPSNYFNLIGVSDLSEILACSLNNGFTLEWVNSFVFDGDFSFGGSIIHEFANGAKWLLNGKNVTNVVANMPDIEVITLDGGNIDLINYSEYKLLWFSIATVSSINDYIASSILYNKDMLFYGEFNVDTFLAFSLLTNQSLTVTNLNVIGISSTNTIVTAGQAEITFRSCIIAQFNSASGIVANDNAMIFDNCNIYNGYMLSNSNYSKTIIKNSNLDNIIVNFICSNIYSSIINNRFVNSRVEVKSVGKILYKTVISNNDFSETIADNFTPNNSFISLVPQQGQTDVVIQDLTISGNSYSAIANVPSVLYTYNVAEFSNSLSTWATIGNRINITNEAVNEWARKIETTGFVSFLVGATTQGTSATIQIVTLENSDFTGGLNPLFGLTSFYEFSGINVSFEDEGDKLAGKPILSNISYNNILNNYELNIYCPLGTPFGSSAGNSYNVRAEFKQSFSLT